jgi:threonyl-tRNA synthetase
LTPPNKINAKIQRVEQMKVHTMLVIGKRDMEANAVSVRVDGKGNLGREVSRRSDCGSPALHQRATCLNDLL